MEQTKREVYGMKLIFCIDDKSGMMFFGKRQSQDQNLREWILNYAQGSKLWMSPYSAKQFGNNASVSADDDYMSKAEENDVCLIEDGSYSTDNANEIVLCKYSWRLSRCINYLNDTANEFDSAERSISSQL